MRGGQGKLAADGAAPEFGAQSRWIDLGGPVHYLDFGGPADGPMIICVHGLIGSAVNWSAIGPLLAGRYRVLAPDLAGHGLTQPGGRGTSVAANRALLHRFIGSISASPVILMGNSMGGMISLLEASAAPSVVAGLVLVDPALPLVPARPHPAVAALFALGAMPGLGRVMLGYVHRLPPERAVTAVLSVCCVDVSRVPPGVVAQHVQIARQRAGFPGTAQDISATMRSVLITASIGGQSYRRGLRSITCPVLLLHGEQDRLVPVPAALAAARANPSWSLAVLPGVGHVPQLEAPLETVTAITDWLGSAGRRAAELAAPGRSMQI